MGLEPVFQQPYGVNPIVDDASDKDRLYFEQHPEAVSYVRDYIDDEYGPVDAEIRARAKTLNAAILVEVEQIVPGVRIRRPRFIGGFGIE